MPEKQKKTCYYELLGLDRKCDAAEIKSTYRKLALRMHPDKAHVNGLTVEDATKNFQQIQEAYSVLSDPQERAWYDAHREQILKGHDDGEPAEDPFKTRINLYKYFSSSCYDGFGDGANGFFAVYADLFVAIDTEEAEWEDLDSDEDHMAMPPFGDSRAESADVTAFYRNWLDFCSRKAFGHADKWNPKEAPNRQVRRAMEMENKKARQAAKKEFNAEVRQLVKFVQKRDPRVIAQQKQQMKDTAEKKQRDMAEAQERKATEAKERKERQEAARLADEARWAELAADREARRARGEVVSEDDDDKDEEEEEVQFVCEPCGKKFKSEKAYDQHAKSKKHLQVVEALRRELEREMKKEAKAAKEEAARLEAMEGGGGDAASSSEGSEEEVEVSRQEKSKQEAPSKDSEEEDEGDEDSDDDFLARFAARGGGGRGGRGRGSFAPPPRGGDAEGGGSSASSDAGAGDEAAAGGDGEEADGSRRPAAAGEAAAAAAEEGAGKRAQKKAQQRALLLEKKAQKEGVEELVNGVRKAQKAAKQDADGANATATGEEAESEAKPGRSPKEAATTGGGPMAVAPPDGSRCAVCGEEFPSRSKLFQHIKATGHAALKPMDPPGGAKGKKKKR
mmetsp:Transcript_11327/g.28490  ORF Transcript_11327/g.28490 Transcript_11327/m.28490 type:complete len:621 (-) Transcript_11327:255-2117(-)